MGMTFNAVEVNSLMNSGYSTQIILTSGGTTYIAFAPPNCSIAHTDARWTCCKIVDNGAGLVKKTWTAPNQVPGADGAGLSALTYS